MFFNERKERGGGGCFCVLILMLPVVYHDLGRLRTGGHHLATAHTLGLFYIVPGLCELVTGYLCNE